MPKNTEPQAKIDDAIALVEEARDQLAHNETFVGTGKPGSEGLFGPVIHDLRVLRGRVADPSLNT